MSTLRQHIERALAVTLIVLFVVPLFLTGVRRAVGVSKKADVISRWLDRNWIGEPHLVGVTTPVVDVPLTWRALKSGDFQKRKAREFNEGFATREALIRLTNELWFRLFDQTTLASLDFVVGRHNVLFGRGYLQEYYSFRTKKSALERWVKDLRRLQDFCRSRGMGFVLVLTPNKASIYPEDVPEEWTRTFDPRPRATVLLRELFRDCGISYVDAVDVVAREKLKGPPAPLFPKGGVHWNWRASLATANAIAARFTEENKPIQPIESAGSTLSDRPIGEECDLLNIMNLAFRWRYPCERITVKPRPTPESKQLTLVSVGGSFMWQILQEFKQSGQFSEINGYFYYKLYKTREGPYWPIKVREPATPIDYPREIFAADCLMLELNESSAAAPDHHLSAFLKEALAHLPDPTAPKPAFKPD